MRSRLAIKIHTLLERRFPERRLFLRSEDDTRFIRLRPATQLIAFLGGSLIVAWTIVATAILLMDSIGSGNFREQAKRDQLTYEQRLNDLSFERDARTEEALAAQERFNSALDQISEMQSELLASEARRRELETGIEVIQATLRRTMKERELALAEARSLNEVTAGAGEQVAGSSPLGNDMLDTLSTVLAETTAERDQVLEDAQAALEAAREMQLELALMEEKNDQIFRQLEDAMTISVEPLENMFKAAGMDTDSMLEQVRRGYSGQGGPLMPLAFSTKGGELTKETVRANRLLDRMDELNMYRIAAETAPFAIPIKSAFRYTSGFGTRWGRMHNGTDFAGKHGTPILATADGVVIHADWLSGYGRLIKIKHEFGIETRYAHLAKIRVKVGQRVSQGQHIGDMGNSGRSTGTHLHYEIRKNGSPLNPMKFIKAGRNVF
ncbi:M23 family metallopeptidase [uncultured Shimia sp.]|uniref:M23 family metallopeptidase n=1 Tax=uncultured Shimia sp. TaxID=573152 RepID=UPI002628D2F1|nr:M23 family metallopeptidase [uncultured Shimia sp.]